MSRSRRPAGLILLEGDGKPLVVEKVIGRGKALLIANGAFLLNEAVVHPARRPLAERVIDWIDTQQLALVEGPFVLLGEAESLTLWALMRRIWTFRWVMIHVCACRSFGRTRACPSPGPSTP